jgi:hypothetical protein
MESFNIVRTMRDAVAIKSEGTTYVMLDDFEGEKYNASTLEDAINSGQFLIASALITLNRPIEPKKPYVLYKCIIVCPGGFMTIGTAVSASIECILTDSKEEALSIDGVKKKAYQIR